jgi:hypothetical protein
MGMGSAPLDAMNKAQAVRQQKRTDAANQKLLTDQWQRSDLFLPAFGGGSSGLLKDIGSTYRGIYGGINDITPSVGDAYNRYSTASSEFAPSLDKSEEIGKSILSGEAGQQLQDLRKPVYAARNEAVATSKQAQQDATAQTLNRIQAIQRGEGYSGASSAGDKTATDAARTIAANIAAQQGNTNVMNASDAASTAIAARDEQIKAALGGLANQMVSGRYQFTNAPLAAAYSTVMAPQQQFNSMVAPYISPNRPAVLPRVAYPTTGMIWRDAAARSMDSIENMAMGAASGQGGGGQGSGGQPSAGPNYGSTYTGSGGMPYQSTPAPGGAPGSGYSVPYNSGTPNPYAGVI